MKFEWFVAGHLWILVLWRLQRLISFEEDRMKSGIRSLLIGALAISLASCNRSNAPDQSVSANGARNERTDQTQPKKTVREARPGEPERSAADTIRTRATVSVPSGTAVRVTLSDTISTENNKEGDSFSSRLSEPVVVNGKIVANKGDRVTGHLTKVDEPGRVKGRARLELVLDEMYIGGKMYGVATEPFIAVASDNHKRDATEIAGGAAVGAAVGAIAGGGKGAAIGAIIGGGSGTTAVLLTKGQQLKLVPETKINFVLSREVELPLIQTTKT